ncbi:F-box domain protein [Cordyceps fumosorosea ARSEF 2679]|uniref:F-box domain protein n=1 Tax=Cordyceps fumosorosea (strain ARSEF 2679) TaxID=1081104 RepID=A0A162K3P5_CORFA|nr:F-box domain protein [Cordyceps fumosorosea ARSEF 2679]OAA52918.1 F-box domain protein [Cordyceps fumosorosea ARSEF 2679]
MTPSLDALSVELMQCILYNLEIADVGALRLASRAANARILRTNYPECFRTKRWLWLDTRSLQLFVRLTAVGQPACSLENLTIVGAAVSSPDELDETSQHRALLAKAFENLKAGSQIGALRSLALTVALRPEEDISPSDEEVSGSEGCKSSGFPTQDFRHWPYVWDLAQQALAVTLHALGDSGLGVLEQLDLFMAPQGCSLYLQKFVDIPVQFPASMASFQGVKELKVSLSPPMKAPMYDGDGFVEEETEVLDDNGRAVAYPANILQDVVRTLIVMAPELETLDLHWFSLNRETRPHDMHPDEAPATLTKPLRDCCLRGLSVSDAQLLAFLQSTRPARVHFEYMQMLGGGWDTVLQHIISASSGIKACHFREVDHTL